MLTAARGAVPGLAPGKLNVEYVAMDGTLHAVPLADAARVRLTDMQPSRRFKARKGAAEPARSLVIGHRWQARGWQAPLRRLGEPPDTGSYDHEKRGEGGLPFSGTRRAMLVARWRGLSRRSTGARFRARLDRAL